MVHMNTNSYNNVNEILISAAVMSTYWEHGRKDMLDILMPFLKYSIASTTKINEKIRELREFLFEN